LLQGAGQAVALPFQFQLLAVVVAPTDPAEQLAGVAAQPALELRPDRGEALRTVHLNLFDMCQLTAEAGQQWSPQRADETLEMTELLAIAGDQAGADLDDLHFFKGPAAFLGGRFQID